MQVLRGSELPPKRRRGAVATHSHGKCSEKSLRNRAAARLRFARNDIWNLRFKKLSNLFVLFV